MENRPSLAARILTFLGLAAAVPDVKPEPPPEPDRPGPAHVPVRLRPRGGNHWRRRSCLPLPWFPLRAEAFPPVPSLTLAREEEHRVRARWAAHEKRQRRAARRLEAVS